MTIIVLDNGGATVKCGVKGADDSCRIIPNAVVRSKGDKMTYFGHEFERCKDYSALHYRLPIEKGYIVDWDAQKAVWDGIFSDEVFDINTTEASLILTEPYFNLPNIQEVYDQFVFEEYEFASYFRCTPASLIPYGDLFTTSGLPLPECMVVVDSGFSFTHVIPILEGKIVWSAVKRLDVGGKLLTNQLKELVSFRQWNMMDETYIMNEVKETSCYVSSDFRSDLDACRLDANFNSIVQEYVLPDLSSNKRGHIRQKDETLVETGQVLIMSNERFTIPEIIFRPDDIGLDQSGLAATIAFSVSLLPHDLQGMFWANIGLVGGSTKFAGFRRRLLHELQSLAPTDVEVVIYEANDAITAAYEAAIKFADLPRFSSQVVTRAEYAENGSDACRKKFRDWKASGPTVVDHTVSKPRHRQREDNNKTDTLKPGPSTNKVAVPKRGPGRPRRNAENAE